MGSTATYTSKSTKSTSPAKPSMSGARVLHEVHGYMTPPHVGGMKKLVVDAMKRNEPNQSTQRSLETIVDGLRFSRRARGTRTIVIPMKGKLGQKIQRQLVWAKTLPIMGPQTLPRDLRGSELGTGTRDACLVKAN